MKKKIHQCAFTLAETLITLVIVGIVAALTIPNLIVKYQKEALIGQLKKNYSVFGQAFNKAVAENGPLKTWTLTSREQILKDYMIPYLKIRKESYTNVNTYNYNRYQYKKLNGENSYFNPGTVFYLEDGTTFYFSWADSHHWKGLKLFVDVNGPKKPNKVGRDIFVFIASSHYYDSGQGAYNNKFIPWGALVRNRSELLSTVDNFACNKEKGGDMCAAVIMYDNWKISNDYPW